MKKPVLLITFLYLFTLTGCSERVGTGNNNAANTEVKWTEVTRFEGNSIKDTGTFEITSSEWRISWDTKPGDYGAMNFQIYIYKPDKSLVDVAANVIGESKDSSVQRGSGEYYLTINSAQPYTVIIEEKK
ncbi:hypothetical protein OXPF_24570 [Oxobacter pfennigii]|uniref:Lipoprotein n=1 Tax=Oxobacter pfennigii TaxID=36849 RepID=A0A0P8YX38_9CLOT|nr:hypothetical protein [Oxobacter pfennigii]KPU44289.1 hypothetical protein OXPF_24570 [Oxobacter pfennigii]